jgi:hypothetical protein
LKQKEEEEIKNNLENKHKKGMTKKDTKCININYEY